MTSSVHYRPNPKTRTAVCGRPRGLMTTDPDKVTCGACLKTDAWQVVKLF